MSDSAADPSARAIRVFVSSTFLDMQDDRDELVNRVFPALRAVCRDRGVDWSEVDLRWGITDEQVAEGRVLLICLEEIARCRPYFIGLLGERYGWVPDDIPQEMIEREPCLAQYRDRSVTELEIVKGVLEDPAMAEHARFYLRDPAYVESMPEEKRRNFIEVPRPDDIERYGEREAERRAEQRHAKLNALKRRIRESGLPVREGYADPEDLGRLVYADMMEIIDRLFPADDIPTPVDMHRTAQQAFARSRAADLVGRADLLTVLDTQARHVGPPLLVVGDTGSGRSALLARWVSRSADAALPVVAHFVEASAESRRLTTVMQSIVAGLSEHFEIRQETSTDSDALRLALADAICAAAAQGGVCIVLDGLDELEAGDGAQTLAWLPESIPPEVRLVGSAAEGVVTESWHSRGWRTVELPTLHEDERTELICRYLRRYGKRLTDSQTVRIAASPSTGSPQFTRVLLNELRVYGEHERLDARIDELLGARTTDELLGVVFERYEREFERDAPGLVGDTLSLLSVSRDGIPEADLVRLLEERHGPMARQNWSALHLSGDEVFASTPGGITLAGREVRQAVTDRYVTTTERETEVRRALIRQLQAARTGHRKARELPWQMVQLRDWKGLMEALSDVALLRYAWADDRYEVLSYWACIGSELGITPPEAYGTSYEEDLGAPSLQSLGELLQISGHPSEAQAAFVSGLAAAEQAGDDRGRIAALRSLAMLAHMRREYHRARGSYERALELARALDDPKLEAAALGDLATATFDANPHSDRAMELLQQQEELARRTGDRYSLQSCLHDEAVILSQHGRMRQALTLLEEAAEICTTLGYRRELASVQINLSAVRGHLSPGHFGGVPADLLAAEATTRQLGDVNVLAAALGQQATALARAGQIDEALRKLEEAERLFREAGDRSGLLKSLEQQAALCAQSGRRRSGERKAVTALSMMITDGGSRSDRAACADMIRHMRRPPWWLAWLMFATAMILADTLPATVGLQLHPVITVLAGGGLYYYFRNGLDDFEDRRLCRRCGGPCACARKHWVCSACGYVEELPMAFLISDEEL